MRALWRRLLAPLFIAAAVVSATGLAHIAAGPSHHRAPMAACPAGTNWDAVTGTCH